MGITIQYIIIFILFVGAVYFILKPFFGKKNGTPGCGKGCSCNAVAENKTK